jgi:DNA-binding CsgD family transcriptional regulator
MRGKADLLEIIDLIYEAAVDMKAWAAALIAIAGALSAHAAVFELVDPETKKAPLVMAPLSEPEWLPGPCCKDAEGCSGLVMAPLNEPEWLQTYAERWVSADVLRDRAWIPRAGMVYQLEGAIPRSGFDRTRFYNEFYVPQRLNFCLATDPSKDRGTAVGTVFFRSAGRGRFASDDEGLLRALGPHLQRAVALNLRLGRLQMERDGAVEMLNRCEHGAILVDAGARILFVNNAAEALLGTGDGLRGKAGRLAAATQAKTMALRGLIASEADGIPGGVLALPCRDGRRLAALVLPLRAETNWLAERPAAIVFVKDPAAEPLPSAAAIRRLFDLTPTQAALAREILQGDGIEAAAGRLGIARSTARTHLLEVFQKTGTSRQAELVRVLLQHAPPTRPPG